MSWCEVVEWEEGTALLEEAVAAYRAALGVFERGGAEFYVGIVRTGLQQVEALINTRRTDSAQPD